MKEHAIDAGGVRLHVEEHGAGSPVVFGHSLLCDGTMFARQVQDLSAEHRVLNVDFRGHGRSGVPAGPYSILDQAEDYRRVLDALSVERALFVGLSMGAMAAMHLALEHPSRVAGLVLMNTSAAPEEPWTKRLQYRAMARTAQLFGMRPFLQAKVRTIMFGASFRRERPEVVEHWLGRFAALDRQGLARAVEMVVSRPGIEHRLHELRTPALVIAGAEDSATPPSKARRLADALPGARLEILPGTGHLSTIERPEQTTALIGRFLSDIGY
jgi:3-oxoadipate enol-lactonase